MNGFIASLLVVAASTAQTQGVYSGF